MPKKSLSATVLALGAAALFVAGLFLPAVDLVPWAPGFNTMMLSFIGVFTLGAGSIPHFIACLMGALANLAMLWTFVQKSVERGSNAAFQSQLSWSPS